MQQVQNKAELAAVDAENARRQQDHTDAVAAWGALAEPKAYPQPDAPTALVASTYTAEDVTVPTTVATESGEALLLAGTTKITALDGTVFGVAAADFAAGWQPAA